MRTKQKKINNGEKIGKFVVFRHSVDIRSEL